MKKRNKSKNKPNSGPPPADDTVLLTDEDEETLNEVHFGEPGDIIQGRYVIHRTLGQGGMGKVYLTEDVNQAGVLYAVKQSSLHPVHYRSFADEAKMLMRLDHENLPKMVDFFSDEKKQRAWLIMEYIEGQSLLERFEAANRKMEEEDIVRIALQLCHVLHYLHTATGEPIIYRDLKPGNIMINPEGLVKLIDFGIAREYKEGQNQDTVQIGTVGFAAPEQFEDKQSDVRTDLFSLGAVMYYLATGGKYVYANTGQTNLLTGFGSPEFVSIVNRLVRMNPKERYHSATAVQTDLNLLYGEQETTLLEGSHVSAFQKTAKLTKNMNVTSILFALLSTMVAFLTCFGMVQLLSSSTIRNSWMLAMLNSLEFDGQTQALMKELAAAWQFSLWDAMTLLHGGNMTFDVESDAFKEELQLGIPVLSLFFIHGLILFVIMRIAFLTLRKQGPVFFQQKWPYLLLSSVTYSILVSGYVWLSHPSWQYRDDDIVLYISATSPGLLFLVKCFLLFAIAGALGLKMHKDINWPLWVYALGRSSKRLGLGLCIVAVGLLVQYSLTSPTNLYQSTIVSWGELFERAGLDLWYVLMWPNFLFQALLYGIGAPLHVTGSGMVSWLGVEAPFSAHILGGVHSEASGPWISQTQALFQQTWLPYVLAFLFLSILFQMRQLPLRFIVRIVITLTITAMIGAWLTGINGYAGDTSFNFGVPILMSGLATFIVSIVFFSIMYGLKRVRQQAASQQNDSVSS
ncbi:serine/threonine protein kinase [Aureibacillus halotolerans]|uniref:Serine/threonine protein kinase n=1 Tax=Aureibacillus halotolerans TaxID=1508390 RepID=A0A4R6UB93_9BACI|nr:serine/threonine-protein kinase [Aureibacillus halotolerans]TDQ42219.1 serine/threonine protein kinase [Aureibacillus halotolerans]